MVRYNLRWLSVIGIRGRFGTWTAWNANHSNLKDSFERSERGGKFFSGFRATYELRGTVDVSGSATTWSPFMAFPGQDPEDRRESKWRTSYGRLRPFVSLSRPVSSPIVYRSLDDCQRHSWYVKTLKHGHGLLLCLTRPFETITLGGRATTNTMLSNRTEQPVDHCRSSFLQVF